MEATLDYGFIVSMPMSTWLPWYIYNIELINEAYQMHWKPMDVSNRYRSFSSLLCYSMQWKAMDVSKKYTSFSSLQLYKYNYCLYNQDNTMCQTY